MFLKTANNLDYNQNFTLVTDNFLTGSVLFGLNLSWELECGVTDTTILLRKFQYLSM